MKRTNTTSEIREYTPNVDEPIVISRSLLEEVGINPYADINIHLQNGTILIQPKSILGRLPEGLLLLYEEIAFANIMEDTKAFTLWKEQVEKQRNMHRKERSTKICDCGSN